MTDNITKQKYLLDIKQNAVNLFQYVIKLR